MSQVGQSTTRGTTTAWWRANLLPILLAGGGLLMLLVAAMSLGAGSGDKGASGFELNASATAGVPIPIAEAGSDLVIYVASIDGRDPRPGAGSDPGLCSIESGGGTLSETSADLAMLGDTTLYPVAAYNGFSTPASVTCQGAGIRDAYAGTPGGAGGGQTGWRAVGFGALGLGAMTAAAFLALMRSGRS